MSHDRVPGALLGDGTYRLERPLASGAMGTVWRATHVTLGRPVAVKFVDADSSEVVIERFLREARLAAGIRHPHVVSVLDFGRFAEGEAFMVMELLDGPTFEIRRASTPPLTTLEIVQIAAQILSGLEEVHRCGIVHGDVKPANISLSEGDGEPFARLLDFGVAYSIDPASELRRGRFGTSTQLIVGTPEYMSPEQAEGRPDVDGRADVYAMGVLLYEALSGRLPFEAAHPGGVLHAIMCGVCVPFGERRPDLPQLALVIDAAMHHDRERRPASARELGRLLLRTVGLAGDARSTPPPPLAEGGEDAEGAAPSVPPAGTLGIDLDVDASAASAGRSAPSAPSPRARRRLTRVALATAAVLFVLGMAALAGDSALWPLASASELVPAPEVVPVPPARAAVEIDPGAVEAEPLLEPSAPVVAPDPVASPRRTPRASPAPRAVDPPSRRRGEVVRELDF